MALASVRMFRTAQFSFSEIIAQNKRQLKFSPICRQKHTVFVRTGQFILENNNTTKLWKSSKLLLPSSAITSVRWSSQGVESKPPIFFDEASLPPIPTPPSLPTNPSYETVTEFVELVGKEPSLADYGLGNWTPVGLVQNCLEYFHIALDLPWWGSIFLGTLILRTLVFPIVIMSQRNTSKMSNNLPQLQRLQAKMTEARQSGNNFEAARVGQEMMKFMKDNDMNPLKNMLPPLAQAPLFISMFMGLRSMANVPVESFRTGGMLWFMDLTVPDQYYLLPIITSATLAATIEMGTDSTKASQLGMVRYVLRALPILIFPFTMNFPGAVLCYWVSTNFISLIQVGFLRIPKVRQYFKIEPLMVHPKDALMKKKGFVDGFRESMSNMKVTREIQERQQVDSVNFQKAGRAPIQRTFKYDPTKVTPKTTNEMIAKKKER